MRYDGVADWYDATIREGRASRVTAEAERLLVELLGPGSGRCLDAGCGGGVFLQAIADLGWSVVGVDVSADQLRVARPRARAAGAELIEADATDLPFGDAEFDAVVGVLTSTDIEPWEKATREAARVLGRGGVLIHIGAHPCFVGPHSLPGADGTTRTLGTGYRDRRTRFDSPAFRPDGIRARVGAAHVPLDDLLNGLMRAGLTIERVVESADADPPTLLAVRARRD